MLKEGDKAVGSVCEICHKVLQGRKAYAGHMWLAHHKRVGVIADLDSKIAKAFDMNIALNRRLDRIEEAMGYLAAYQNEEVVADVGKFLTGNLFLKQWIRDLLYKGREKGASSKEKASK